MQYILDHTTVAFGLIDILSLAVLAAAIVIVWRKLKKMRDRQEELEKKLSENYAGEHEEL